MRQRNTSSSQPPAHASPPHPSPSSSSSCDTSSRTGGSSNDSSDDEQHRTTSAAAAAEATTATTTTTAAQVDAAATSRGARAKRWLKKKLIPEFVHEYGRTVYGGNPLVQQTLPGFFNYPSPFILVPILYVLTVPFLVVGVEVLVKGSSLHVVEQEYSQIHQYQYVPSDPSVNVNQGIRQFTADGVTHSQGTRTWLELHIGRRIKAPVYMYYKISNMHQNHRDFHDGRSNAQLTGKAKIGNTYMCKPYTYPGFRENEGHTPITVTLATGAQVTRPASSFTYNPCGIAPWSMFNDTFVLYRAMTAAEVEQASASGRPVLRGGADGVTPVQLICNGTDFGVKGQRLGQSATTNLCKKEGISWSADTKIRFHNMTLREDWWSLYYPRPTTNEYLRNGWYLHEPGHALPDPSDLDLQVWMRASFTTSFRKLYRIIDVTLHPGTYLVDISEFYDVVSFRGRKSILLQHTGWVGGRNIGLGAVFIVMGCLTFVLGVAFTVECLLQRKGVNRYEHLDEPKRSWYVFPPNDPEFANYYQLRLRRHVPMAQLQSLRRAVAELEGLERASGAASLAQQPQSDDANAPRT
ncbi:LEM3 (ligand-effect modulator 3) family / CDC50 family [Novymonas esmeraldas]|uniref:LEM3 (Ligand-effect modulator 3) family / CDC50 family n=1 Tax=Novymonas esmeraldas TaxID=1808958 RepID=A0AAW0F0D5_9TRYP